MIKSSKSLFSLIKSDLYRYNGVISLKEFIKNFYLNKGFNLCLYFRIGQRLRKHVFLFKLYNLLYKMKCNKYTIDMPLNTDIQQGLYIGHPFSIALSKDCKIGCNVNISQGVTIGQKQIGKLKGSPTIGDNVYLGPNSTIIGKIMIGNNVVIGANSVVTKDIPDNFVMAGVPAKEISKKGSTGIVNNRYER